MKKVFAVSILAILATGAANAQIASQAYVDKVTEGMATQTWVGEQGFLKEHQSLAEYAKKTEVTSEIGEAKTELEGKIDQKIGSDALTPYQTIAAMNKNTLNGESTTTYASEKTVADAIAAEIGKVTGGDLKTVSDKVTSLETTKQDALTAGNGIDISEEDTISVKADGDTITVGTNGIKVADGKFVTPDSLSGTLGDYVKDEDLETTLEDYQKELSAGNGIDITSDTVSVKIKENSKLILDANGLDVNLSDYVTSSSLNTTLGDYQEELTEGNGITISDENQISVKTQTNGHITATSAGIAVDFSGLGQNTDFQASISGALNSEQEDLQKAVDSAVAGAIAGGTDTPAALTEWLGDNLDDYSTTEEVEGKISEATKNMVTRDGTAVIGDGTHALTVGTDGKITQHATELATKAEVDAKIPKPDPNTCTDATDGCVLKFVGGNYSWEPIAGEKDVQGN